MVILFVIVGILSAVITVMILALVGILYDNPEKYGRDESIEIAEDIGKMLAKRKQR